MIIIPKFIIFFFPILSCSTPTGIEKTKNHMNTMDGINCAMESERSKSFCTYPVETPTISTNPIIMKVRNTGKNLFSCILLVAIYNYFKFQGVHFSLHSKSRSQKVWHYLLWPRLLTKETLQTLTVNLPFPNRSLI